MTDYINAEVVQECQMSYLAWHTAMAHKIETAAYHV